MGYSWFRHDQEAVEAALRRGERPDMATTMASGPLDELVALHDELGIFAALEDLSSTRQRRGIEETLLLRTAAVLPFLPTAALSGAATQLFGEPAVLLRLGWSPLQIQMGTTNGIGIRRAGVRSHCLVIRKPSAIPWRAWPKRLG